ncbi:hypothetical protein CVU76_03575 [Candidatus Dojkabacteria bacterium HGW-Dojkabacteria-1]|uniref:7 transmembrane helices usually fused to an inactive transglutaminase domain-containing protein n=1 Tax=Candidatus Dojkabacteria bacterium HGW-Dojkabacteria-1 TaxID=2013761 RepID=A0A2N2F4J8_9BACT|nr:MAG: hypothetical protein CVU76_03575 [Candidatus Dojkabacteria bacterium HGW-Dojkabacteria-1]
MFETSGLTEWILQHGVSKMALELLIAVAVLATIVSIARYVIGSKTYGIYAPILLAIAYSYTGLKYGLAITIIVILTSLLSYNVLKRIRMHYITRIATNYTILAMVLVLFFVLIDMFGLGLENMANIPPLAFISIAALSDFFIKQYVKKSFAGSILTLTGTILVAAIGWFVITREIISEYMINNLWVLPLLTLVNLLLGQFTGLRIKDYFRFKLSNRDDSSN